MPAGKLNLEFEPGATFFLPVTYTVNSSVVNLTGYSIQAIFQAAPGTDPSLVLTTANGGILATPLLGQFSLYATNIQTEQLKSVSGPGVWLLQVINNNLTTPFVKDLIRGKIIIDPEI